MLDLKPGNKFANIRELCIAVLLFAGILFADMSWADCADITFGSVSITPLSTNGQITALPTSVTVQALPNFNPCPAYYDTPLYWRYLVYTTPPAAYTLRVFYTSEVFPYNSSITPPAVTVELPASDFDLGVSSYCFTAQLNRASDNTTFQHHTTCAYAFIVTVDVPSEGVLVDGCSFPVSGRVNYASSDYRGVSINIDGGVSTANIAPWPAGPYVPPPYLYNTTRSALSGLHTLTATYGDGSTTVTFTSLCKGLYFIGPTGGMDSRVLIHNYGATYFGAEYTSSYQQQLNNGNGSDGEIAVQFIVRKDSSSGEGIPDQTVYFRVKDPAESSPYLSGIADDNTGGDKSTTPKRPATLGGSGVSEISAGVWSATSDSNGVVEVVLQIPGSANNPTTSTNLAPASGDNYIVEASFDQNFSSGPVVVSSTITAWKRVYVERATMFRNGAYVKGVDSTAGSTQVHVTDVSVFKNATRIKIIHAPRLDGNIAPDFGFFYSEEHNILSIVNDTDGSKGGYLVLGTTVKGKPQFEKLQYDYWFDDSFGNTDYHLSDGVGVITGSAAQPADLFDVNFPGYVGNLFAGAFVEYQEVPPSTETNHVPFEKVLTSSSRETLGNKWFKNASRIGAPGAPVNANSNYQHLIAATGELNTPRQSYYGNTKLLYGTTNYSFVYVETIEKDFRTADRPNANGEVTAHELAHQWWVNHTLPLYDSLNGHCNQKMYNNSAKLCEMNSALTKDDFKDGVVAFHYVLAGEFKDSEYLVIRTKAEPIPQSQVP